jgi:hypothetical protein
MTSEAHHRQPQLPLKKVTTTSHPRTHTISTESFESTDPVELKHIYRFPTFTTSRLMAYERRRLVTAKHQR